MRIDNIFINLLLKGKEKDWQSLGVLPEMIESDIRPVFNFVTQHWRKEGKWPEKQTVKQHYQFFRFYKAKEPITYYAKEIKSRFKAAKLREALGDITEAFNENDIEKAVTVAVEKTKELSLYTGEIKIIEYTESLADAAKNILERKHTKAEYSFGIPALDRDLIGMERGDWAVIAGLPKRGKTWVLLRMLLSMWLDGLKVLLISMELKSKLITRRLDSMIAKVPYDRFRCGQLTDEEIKYFEGRAKKLQRAGGRLMIVSAENHDFGSETKFGSVESVYNYARRFKPDIIAVDGVYIGMNLEWEDATRFTNEFHLMLQQLGNPGLSTTQLKQISDPANPKFTDLAFSAGFGQACDFLFLLGGDENMRRDHQSIMKTGLAREAMDGQSYVVTLNPGKTVDFSPIQDTTKNYLRDDDEGGAQPEKNPLVD